MNLKEGTWRLALLLGVVGAIFGGLLSFFQCQSIMRQREDHQRFQQLASSAIVGKARKACFGPGNQNDWIDVPIGTNAPQRPVLDPASGEPVATNEAFCFWPTNESNAVDYILAESNSSSLKTVHFKNRELASIETTEKHTYYPTPAPSAWMYAEIALLPLLGFCLPWSIVRAIGWVVAGFVASPK